MSEEDKIIDRVMMIDQWKVAGDIYTQDELNAIGELLDLYIAEKEKNREAIQYCKKDLAFKRRLEKAKDTIDNYNAGRFDTSESILNILEE